MASSIILQPLHAGPQEPFSLTFGRLATPSRALGIAYTVQAASRLVMKHVITFSLVKEALLKAYRPHPVCRSPFVAQWCLQLHQESPQVVHTKVAPSPGVEVRPHQLQCTLV